MIDFNKRLRVARLASRMSQTEVASKCNLSVEAVSSLEQPGRENKRGPSLYTVAQLAKAFNMNLSGFFLLIEKQDPVKWTPYRRNGARKECWR